MLPPTSMMNRPSLVLGAFFILSLAQFVFERGEAQRSFGLALIVAAGVLLVVDWLGARNRSAGGEFTLPRWRSTVAAADLPGANGAFGITWWLLGSGLLVGAVNLLLLRAPERESYLPIWLLWVGSMVLVGTSLLGPWRLWLRTLSRVLSIDRLDALVVLALTMTAAALRLPGLGDVPPNMSGDEASWGSEAVRVLSGEIRNPFTYGWLDQPTLPFWFAAPFIEWVGRTASGARLPWALVGSLTPGIAYLLATTLLGRALGLVVGTLVCWWAFPIHFSRVAHGMAADSLLTSLALLLFFSAVRASGASDLVRRQAALVGFGVSAACGGLALYGYTGARLAAAVLVSVAVPLFIRTFRSRRSHHWLLAMIALAAVTAGPLAQMALEHPEQFNARWLSVGIAPSGWLDSEVVITGQSKLRLVAEQTARSFLAFNLYPDSGSHYASPHPLLSPVAGVFFLVGLLQCTLRATHLAIFPIVAWWWGGLLGSILTSAPPESQRLAVMAVPTCFFVAIGLHSVGTATVRLLLALRASRSNSAILHEGPHEGAREHPVPSPTENLQSQGADSQALAQRTGARAAFGVAVLLGVHSAGYYFLVFSPQRLAGNPHSMVATELARWLNTFPNGTELVFLGAPAMYAGFPTIPYLAAGTRLEDALGPVTSLDEASQLCRRSPTLFAALPERAGELDIVVQRFPGSMRQDVPLPTEVARHGLGARFLYSRVVVSDCDG